MARKKRLKEVRRIKRPLSTHTRASQMKPLPKIHEPVHCSPCLGAHQADILPFTHTNPRGRFQASQGHVERALWTEKEKAIQGLVLRLCSPLGIMHGVEHATDRAPHNELQKISGMLVRVHTVHPL